MNFTYCDDSTGHLWCVYNIINQDIQWGVAGSGAGTSINECGIQTQRVTSVMIYHHGVSLSEQHTDRLICHYRNCHTQVDIYKPTARTATVNVATYAWTKLYTKLMSWISDVYKCCLCMALPEVTSTVVIEICTACWQPAVVDLYRHTRNSASVVIPGNRHWTLAIALRASPTETPSAWAWFIGVELHSEESSVTFIRSIGMEFSEGSIVSTCTEQILS